MCGPAKKGLNMTMNLLPFALVIWGFYSMVWGITVAGKVHTFRTYIKSYTCSDPTYNDNCRQGCASPAELWIPECESYAADPYDFDQNVQVTELYKAEESFNEEGIVIVLVWAFVNAIWMGIYIKNSGAMSHPWGTVGYHYQNVKAMRSAMYTNYGYFVLLFLFGIFVWGMGQIDADTNGMTNEEAADKEDQIEKMRSTFLNGLFQSLMGFLALLTPVPDTIKYGDKLMSLEVSGQPWTNSRSVMEKFQDALAAARAGDIRYLKDMTGCRSGEVKEILEDVKAIEFELSFVAKMTNMILCREDKTAETPNVQVEVEMED